MDTGSKTRAEELYRRLRSDILTGQLTPGARLPFAELCARYDASTGVLREALPRLVERGLVVSEPQIGFRVVSLSAEDLRHLTETRVTIETLVLRQSIEHGDLAWESRVLAAHHTLSRSGTRPPGQRINEAWLDAHAIFHSVLLEGCPNPRLKNIADVLRDSAEIYRCWSGEVEHDRDVPSEHQRILDAALSHDADEAVAALTEHIELTTQLLLQATAGEADPPTPAKRNRRGARSRER